MSRELAREREALHRLAAFRKLDATQLERFMFDDSNVRPHSREVITRRVLHGLRKRGLIARTPRVVGGPSGGSARSVYHLTDAGYRLLARLDPSFRRPKAAPHDALLIEHSLMTADVMIAFRRSAQSHLGHELREWDNDWQVAESHYRGASTGEQRYLPRVVEFDFAAIADLQGALGPLGAIWQFPGRTGLYPLIRDETPDTNIA